MKLEPAIETADAADVADAEGAPRRARFTMPVHALSPMRRIQIHALWEHLRHLGFSNRRLGDEGGTQNEEQTGRFGRSVRGPVDTPISGRLTGAEGTGSNGGVGSMGPYALKDAIAMKIPCSPVSCRGFTRADLLGVLAIGLLLTLLVVGSGSVNRSTAEAVACLSNHRHVIRAWSEHAQDNQFLLRRRRVSSGLPRPFWGDWVDWGASQLNTNVATVLTPEFSPYVGSDASVFRCPSDRFLSSEQTRLGWRYRVRTMSMNSHVGAESADFGGNFPTYLRLDDFTSPSETFVFVEEHPGSINDTSFATDTPGARNPVSLRLVDIPASFHGRGGHLGFADGHAELHRWVGTRAVQPVVGGRSVDLNIPAPNDPDAIWLGLHASQMR